MRLAALLCCAAILAGAEVRLRPQAEVLAPLATLGDCAEIVAEPELRERLAACTLVELPDLGRRTVGEREVLAACARAAAGRPLAITGTCSVGRGVRVIPAADLAAAAAALCPGAEIQVVRPGASLTVPAGGTLEIRAEPLDQSLVGEVPFRVRALVDGGEAGRTLVALRISRQRDVVVITRAIARGDEIQAGDLRRERRQATRQDAQAVADPAVAAGKVARVAIAAGTILQPHLIEAPPVVRAGEPVQLVFRGPGFEVATAGTALSPARAGERIAVRREADGTVLHGSVEGPGRVLAERR